MKKIEAIVRPHIIDEIREALVGAGFRGMTLSEVRGFGRQKGHSEVYRGAEYLVDFLPKIKLEMVITEKMVEKAVAIIIKYSKSGKVGDGKIFIYPVDDAIRVRTEETGEDAI